MVLVIIMMMVVSLLLARSSLLSRFVTHVCATRWGVSKIHTPPTQPQSHVAPVKLFGIAVALWARSSSSHPTVIIMAEVKCLSAWAAMI